MHFVMCLYMNMLLMHASMMFIVVLCGVTDVREVKHVWGDPAACSSLRVRRWCVLWWREPNCEQAFDLTSF